MARKPLSIIDLFSLDQPFATEFRRLLHRVRKHGESRETKAIMITSAMLAEGKSTIAALLALTAARQKGLKTLLIDSDLRRPSIHKFFSTERAPGLADTLGNGVAAADVIRKTALENLHLITAGRATPQPAEVFDAEAIGTIIEEMKFFYDLIIVDAAPLLPVSDPLLLAAKVDGLLLVVKAGSTQREVVERAVDMLELHRDRVLGVILNNVNNSLPYYYDYRYYGYQYPTDKPTEGSAEAGRRHWRRGSRGAAGPSKDNPIKQQH